MWSTYQNYDVMPGADAAQPLLSFTAIGAFSLYDRAKFLDLSGFDPLTAMVEDVELSYRAWKRGWLVRYEPRGVACHDAARPWAVDTGGAHSIRFRAAAGILMHWMLLHDPRMFRKHQLLIAARLLTGWLALDYRFTGRSPPGWQTSRLSWRRGAPRERRWRRTDRELLDMLQHFTAPLPLSSISRDFGSVF